MLRFAALITYGAILCAQTPRFEVASVKPSGPKSVRGEEGGPGKRDPIHYRFDKATFKDLIGIAYDVHYFQISSKASLDRDDFDVEAVVPVGATRDDFRVMMRGLLAERFHLESHLESRIFPAYELQIAKSGAKLKEAGSPEAQAMVVPVGFPKLPPGKPGLSGTYTSGSGFYLTRITARQQPASQLAAFLHLPEEMPIVDKTGLTGKYDFTLEYATDLPGASRPEGSTLPAATVFTALQEQLGLQLVAKKLPFDVVVVDAVDRTPTEN